MRQMTEVFQWPRCLS